MDLNNKILEFLDGTSDLEDDKELLRSLADNPEMLSKMKKLMVMEGSIQNNPEYFEPSVETSNKVFDSLGFSYGSKQSMFAGLGSFLFGSKITTAAISSIVTIILLSTYFLYFNVDSIVEASGIGMNKEEKAIVSASKVDEEISEPEIITKYVNKIEYVTADENGKAVKFSSFEELMAYQNDRIEELASKESAESGSGRNSFRIGRSKIANNVRQRINGNYNSAMPEKLGSSDPFGEFNLLTKSENDIEIAFLSSLNNNNPQNVSGNSISFRLSYLPVDFSRYKFGAEVSKENFYQSFTENIDGTRTLNYTQNPSLWTLGVSGRIYLYKNEGYWNPYFQISGGGAITDELGLYPGFFYRTMIGAEISPNFLPFDLNIGLQSTNLSTQRENNFINSNNTSLIFGVNF